MWPAGAAGFMILAGAIARQRQSARTGSRRLAGGIRLKLLRVSLLTLLSVALPQLLSTHAVRAAGILFFVTTVDDHDDGACNADCTLREAIKAANANPGDDDGIEFTVTGTINLTSVLPDITGGVSIDGPDANMLTVRRFDSDTVLFRIFNVTTTGTVAFSGMTISNGISNGQSPDNAGGGISNSGTDRHPRPCIVHSG
jgi:CSLREA domain-containing protein